MPLHALPFLISYALAPAVVLAALHGGWWLGLPFLIGWVLVPLLDRFTGLNIRNVDPATPEDKLFWHRAVLILWVPVQMAVLFWCLWTVPEASHLVLWEKFAVFAGLGVVTGGIGITFAHEMVHQRATWERRMGDLLLVSTAYGHFATEHVFGHHITVGTPKDPVSARKGEWFWAFFLRAVFGSLVSAWRIDRERLARRGRKLWHRSNPFWRYGLGLVAWLAAAWLLGGWLGVALFFTQALVAIYQLEAVNYVEHYGLTREYLGDGKFERVRPHHSWNASQAVSNWFLINLQRHSDHHFRPDRRYPLLQHYKWDQAPQLPFGYSAMIAIAIFPPIWFWMMDKRLERWRSQFYPHIEDWSRYDDGTIGAT
ncbi:MAG: alkane 1-monooxygenase [Pseudomonadota bacterium]